MTTPPEPSRPSNLDDRSRRILEALAARGYGRRVAIGGAVGLLHYLDYRTTHDLDAWWSSDCGPDDREEVTATAVRVLGELGEVRTRRWGDVVSVELATEQTGKADRFSFQIAERAARLQPPTSAGWVDVDLDSLPDLIASKMVAMVERGAPRDLRDIHAVCGHGLVEPGDCWRWWREREELADRPPEKERARVAVETHLARLEQHRPLATIEDADERERASTARRWFEEVLLRELD